MTRDAVTHFTDLLNRLDGADLIVGMHDGHENSIVRDGSLKVIQRDEAFRVDREIRDTVPTPLKLLTRLQNR